MLNAICKLQLFGFFSQLFTINKRHTGRMRNVAAQLAQTTAAGACPAQRSASASARSAMFMNLFLGQQPGKQHNNDWLGNSIAPARRRAILHQAEICVDGRRTDTKRAQLIRACSPEITKTMDGPVPWARTQRQREARRGVRRNSGRQQATAKPKTCRPINMCQ